MGEAVGFLAPSRPFCVRCNRPVEMFGYSLDIETVFGPNGPVATNYTRRATVTVSCHGETWGQEGWIGR